MTEENQAPLAGVTSLSDVVRINAVKLFVKHEMAAMRDELPEFFDNYGAMLESLVSIINQYGDGFDWLIPKFQNIIMKAYRQYESFLEKKND
jgi:hypothetical protein